MARSSTPPATGMHPSLRFLLRFGLTFGALEALIVGLLWRESWFAPYASLNAALTARLLGPWIDGLQAVSGYLLLPGDSIVVKPGCDSYQASAVLLAGIVAFPATARQRLLGAALGLPLLLMLNVGRLATLVLARVHRPDLFDRLHVEILPGVFVFAALGLWLGWILWVRPAPQAT